MAWVLNYEERLAFKDHEDVWADEDDELRFQAICDQVENEVNEELDRLTWRDAEGGVHFPYPIELSIWFRGYRFPKVTEPFRCRFIRPPSEFCDTIRVRAGTAISNKIYDVIESIEPNTHNYFPLELYHASGRLDPDFKRVFEPFGRLDTVALEHSRAVVNEISNRVSPTNCTAGDFTPLKVWKDKVAGHTIWNEYRVGRNLLSDVYVEKLKKVGVLGYEFDQHLEEV